MNLSVLGEYRPLVDTSNVEMIERGTITTATTTASMALSATVIALSASSRIPATSSSRSLVSPGQALHNGRRTEEFSHSREHQGESQAGQQEVQEKMKYYDYIKSKKGQKGGRGGGTGSRGVPDRAGGQHQYLRRQTRLERRKRRNVNTLNKGFSRGIRLAVSSSVIGGFGELCSASSSSTQWSVNMIDENNLYRKSQKSFFETDAYLQLREDDHITQFEKMKTSIMNSSSSAAFLSEVSSLTSSKQLVLDQSVTKQENQNNNNAKNYIGEGGFDDFMVDNEMDINSFRRYVYDDENMNYVNTTYNDSRGDFMPVQELNQFQLNQFQSNPFELQQFQLKQLRNKFQFQVHDRSRFTNFSIKSYNGVQDAVQCVCDYGGNYYVKKGGEELVEGYAESYAELIRRDSWSKNADLINGAYRTHGMGEMSDWGKHPIFGEKKHIIFVHKMNGTRPCLCIFNNLHINVDPFLHVYNNIDAFLHVYSVAAEFIKSRMNAYLYFYHDILSAGLLAWKEGKDWGIQGVLLELGNCGSNMLPAMYYNRTEFCIFESVNNYWVRFFDMGRFLKIGMLTQFFWIENHCSETTFTRSPLLTNTSPHLR